LPSAETRTVAFMDIGTNSIRLLLVRLHPNHSYTILTELRQIVRLGDGEFASQHLQPAAMERTILVAKEFAELARANGADDIVAVATAATREADNQDDFVKRLQAEAQFEVRVIAGLEEARLIYLGVSHGIHLGDKQAFFIDIGGGSTEVIIGSQYQHAYVGSLKLGAIRLTTQFLPEACKPVPLHMYNTIQRYVRHHAVRTLREMQGYHIDLAIGSSGTIRNVADVAARRFYKRPLQQDDVLTYAHLRQVVALLAALPLEERRKVPGLQPERADIILAGAAILDAFMQELGVLAIHVSERGLREGLLVDYLLKHKDASLLAGLSVRARSVLQLGRACHFDEVHAQTTARLALGLFDSARDMGLHRLGAWERELLEYTALLHHIGAFLTYTDYQAHAYYLIRHANLLGFDQKEIALMATTALYQRKALPRKRDAAFAALDPHAQDIVRVLSVFLRLAKHLDRGHASLVQQAWLRPLDAGHVALHIHAAHDCQVEVWDITKRAEAFKKVFGRSLVVSVLPLPASAEPSAGGRPVTPSDPVAAIPPTRLHRRA
jgi:exopolyphosphatase / guanosine-5'-triphosphate,3'-diphosphate pyrophosphatase